MCVVVVLWRWIVWSAVGWCRSVLSMCLEGDFFVFVVIGV